jgi:hypothetical protein
MPVPAASVSTPKPSYATGPLPTAGMSTTVRSSNSNGASNAEITKKYVKKGGGSLTENGKTKKISRFNLIDFS